MAGQAVGDQAVKDGRCPGAAELPAEVSLAAKAEDKTPDIVPEPGKFPRGLARGDYPWRLAETKDLEDDAGRIKHGVRMRAIHRQALRPLGDQPTAARAEIAFFFFLLHDVALRAGFDAAWRY